MAHSDRLSGLLAEQGLSHPEAAKLLHVSLRTLQNWLSGKHQIPYMAFKLLRLMRYMELPGKSWRGWHFSRGMLVTPEGRTITGHEGAWWSMLVRQAKCFGQLYRERIALNASFHQADSKASGGLARVAGAPLDAGLVSVSTSQTERAIQSSQYDVIITSWPTLYDYLTPLTPTPGNDASAWASALTPCSASPLTPTSVEPAQRLPLLPGSSLTAPLDRRRPLNPLFKPASNLALPSAPRPSGGKLPGWNAPPASSENRRGGAA